MNDKLTQTQLSIAGMKCAGCVSSIEKALMAVTGVVAVDVNFANHSAQITGNIDVQLLKNAVQSVGFKAAVQADIEDIDDTENTELQYYHQALKKALVAGLFGFPLMLLGHFNMLPSIQSNFIFWLTVSLISLLVMIYSGGNFFKGAVQSARLKQFNMDTLIALGTGSAWIYSTIIIFFINNFNGLLSYAYFEAAMIILAFINFGSALEIKARGKTAKVIRELIGLVPKTARVIRDGIEIDIPIKSVGLDDILRVRPGEKIAVDGEIVEGIANIDESMLTGEAIPINKTIGDVVTSGTINYQGSFLFKATKIGQDTVLAQIINSVRIAQNSKPDIAKLADKVASIFVPIVMLVSLITFIVWYQIGPAPSINYAFVTAMTVLVIACPCALGLATPIAVMVAVGRAAKSGILIRNGDVLQTARNISYLVLDKTGTITAGKPTVTKVIGTKDYDKTTVLQIAASCEAGSEHPLANAILAKANLKTLEKVDNFKITVGLGIIAFLNHQKIIFGNQKLMDLEQIDYHDHIDNINQLSKQGHTVMLLAIAGEIAGLIAVADTIKEDSKQAIKKIQQQGIAVMMLTGDNKLTAKVIAKEAGIQTIKAEVLPADKAAIIKLLQNQGEVVGMVGDGINDAPALVTANIGFAIGTGADIAIESADVVISGGSLFKVFDLIQLSKFTIRNIKQNLFGAFFYNTVSIPIAAGILYPFFGILLNPMIAGFAMAMSSVTVVANANRLRFIGK